MTNNTGKVKKHKKKFQHLNKNGARIHRKDFIETNYLKGVYDENGNKVIRSLTDEEVDWLDKFYKEYVHSTFTTDSESTAMFKKAKKLSKKPENIKYYEEHGVYPKEVNDAVETFNKKSKNLGNLFHNFWQQRDINSDDYKRKHDIQNNSSKGLQLESFEDMQYVSESEEEYDTQIEDLITESEK